MKIHFTVHVYAEEKLYDEVLIPHSRNYGIVGKNIIAPLRKINNSNVECLDSGAKKVLLPITSAGDLGTVPSDLVGAFSLIFYSSVEEAVFKALGVE